MNPSLPSLAGEPFWSRDPARAALLLVAASTLFHVWFAGQVELSPQEAYYWMWGQRLDWSYYDHPPLASWTIRALGTFFGNSERAIRLSAALHSSIFSCFFFLAARRLIGGPGAFLAVAVALATPLFSLGQVVITPDGPLLAMWAATMYFTVRALDEERGAWLVLAGLTTGLAALGKYTGWLLAPQILLALLLSSRGRRLLRGPWPYLGLLLGLLAFSPVVIWNARHGWVSFGFQFGSRASSMASPSFARTLRFIGLQLLVPTPVLAVVLFSAAFAALRRLEDPALRVAAIFSVPTLAIFTAVSPFTWVKGNWPAPAWPAAMIAAVAFWQERPARWRALSRWALGLAIFFTAYFHAAALFPALPFSARDDTTRGWRTLAARVEAERQRIGPDAFVIGCYYKPAALMSYYLPGRPWTFSSEALGGNGLQFRFWTDPARLLGREGVVIQDTRDGDGWCPAREQLCRPLEELEPLTVERAGMIDLGGLLPRRIATFRLWRCRYAGTLMGDAL
jgi:4-amino-4-deoxy-L-arabinose transferase-like glycosyltransferase